MTKVAIVTDSTAYIPSDLLAQYPIQVAPQVLIWGSENLLDGVDIQPDEFYIRLAKSSVSPTTSQVTPAKFVDMFKRLLEQEYQILAILVSEKLSGTLASARQALDLMPPAPVEIIDSRTTAMAMGFIVLAAARAAADGANLAECKALAEKALPHVGVVFAVDTLEYLHRGGRIGGGAKFLATALNIKPILEISDGRVEAVERVRTRKRSLLRLIELAENRIGGRTPVRLATLHANAAVEASQLLAEASAILHPVERFLSTVSPVVGTHAGPGTIGLAFMAGM